MKNNLTDIKLALTYYLSSVRDFKVEKNKNNELGVYLFQKKNPDIFTLIRIIPENIEQVDDEKWDILNIQRIRKQEGAKFLTIVLLEDSKGKVDTNNEIYISSLKELKIKLSRFFPDIKDFNFFFNPAEDEIMNDESKMYEGKDLREQFVAFNTMLRKPTISSTLFSIVFCFTPFMLLGLYMYSIYSGMFTFMASQTYGSAVANIFFGATNRTLFLDAQQYWRFLTYGLSVFNAGYESGGNVTFSIINLVLLFFYLPIVVKSAVHIQKSRDFWITFIVTYLLLGIFFSLCFNNLVFSGATIVLAIIMGQVLLGTYVNEKHMIGGVIRRKLAIPFILLVLLTLIEGNTSDLIAVPSGIAVSSGIYYLIKYDYKKIDYSLIPAVLIVAFYIVLIGFSFIVKHYVPVESKYIIFGLAQYNESRMFTLVEINKMYQNIGWDVVLTRSLNTDNVFVYNITGYIGQ